MDRLGARLQALVPHSQSLGTDAERLPTSGRGAPVEEQGWYVEIGADGIPGLFGDPSRTDLQEAIAAELLIAGDKSDKSAARPAYLAADADAPGAAVARAVAHLTFFRAFEPGVRWIPVPPSRPGGRETVRDLVRAPT